MPKSDETVHSPCDYLRRHIHVVLVRPEFGGNVGSAARALANMGIQGSFRVVGTPPSIVDESCRKMAKHAGARVDGIQFFTSLAEALSFPAGVRVLKLASTARVGSSNRPHPLVVHAAVEKAVRKLAVQDAEELVLVFGPEGDGLANEEVDLCDWVVSIPSSDEYRSLNLSQAVLIFCYEVNRNLLQENLSPAAEEGRMTQKERFIAHLVQVAEEVGFVLPGDPHKMRPRLEKIFDKLPNHIPGAKTLHGLIDQTIRSVRKGGPDFKGRYKHLSGVRYGNETTGPEQKSS